MTSKRNLGSILAMAGGVVAIAAVITGFIVIGGPGDARERRLDSATMNRVENVISVAQCALNITGAAPASIEDAHALRPPPTQDNPVPVTCGGDASVHPQIKTGEQPAGPGDVVYSAIDATHIRICGSFRRPFSDRDKDEFYTPLGGAYPQLSEPRPAGVHCYEVELLKGADTTANPTSHVGHMGDFE